MGFLRAGAGAVPGRPVDVSCQRAGWPVWISLQSFLKQAECVYHSSPVQLHGAEPASFSPHSARRREDASVLLAEALCALSAEQQLRAGRIKANTICWLLPRWSSLGLPRAAARRGAREAVN